MAVKLTVPFSLMEQSFVEYKKKLTEKDLEGRVLVPIPFSSEVRPLGLHLIGPAEKANQLTRYGYAFSLVTDKIQLKKIKGLKYELVILDKGPFLSNATMISKTKEHVTMTDETGKSISVPRSTGRMLVVQHISPWTSEIVTSKALLVAELPSEIGLVVGDDITVRYSLGRCLSAQVHYNIILQYGNPSVTNNYASVSQGEIAELCEIHSQCDFPFRSIQSINVVDQAASIYSSSPSMVYPRAMTSSLEIESSSLPSSSSSSSEREIEDKSGVEKPIFLTGSLPDLESRGLVKSTVKSRPLETALLSSVFLCTDVSTTYSSSILNFSLLLAFHQKVHQFISHSSLVTLSATLPNGSEVRGSTTISQKSGLLSVDSEIYVLDVDAPVSFMNFILVEKTSTDDALKLKYVLSGLQRFPCLIAFPRMTQERQLCAYELRVNEQEVLPIESEHIMGKAFLIDHVIFAIPNQKIELIISTSKK